MKKTSHYLPEQQIEALAKLYECTGITVSEHIRIAISRYLDSVTEQKSVDTANGNIQG